MRSSHECAICATVAECDYTLVRWKVANGEMFAHDWRCVDRAACRERVTKAGHEWPVADPKFGEVRA